MITTTGTLCPKTRIEVIKTYKKGKLIATYYMPQYQQKTLLGHKWVNISSAYLRSYRNCSSLPIPRAKALSGDEVWIKGFIMWWRELKTPTTTTRKHYDWPE